MKLLYLLIGLIFLVGCNTRETIILTNNSHNVITFNESPRYSLGIGVTHPTGIIFHTDYITFSNGYLNLSTINSSTWLLDFKEVNQITWEIGNDTYIYQKVKG